MKRGDTGRYRTTAAAGETIRAFVPAPLPPVPPLTFDGTLQQALEAAVLEVGRLDGVSSLLPDQIHESNLFEVKGLLAGRQGFEPR